LQGWRARCCASAGLDPVADHQPPVRRRHNLFAADDSYPLMGLLDDPSHHARKFTATELLHAVADGRVTAKD
jgi:hypothetical protein